METITVKTANNLLDIVALPFPQTYMHIIEAKHGQIIYLQA